MINRKNIKCVAFAAALIALFFMVYVFKNGSFKETTITESLIATNEVVSKKCELKSGSSDEMNFIVFDQFSKPQALFNYLIWSNHSSCKLMNDFGGRFIGPPVRGFDGQKAICLLPNSLAPQYNSCVIYSFGINYDWSFDDTMEKYGCEVFSFDPSMTVMKEKVDHSSKVHFFKIGLGSKNLTNDQGWKSLNLESIRYMLGHHDHVIDYLKIDIENHEWEILPQLMETGQLDSIKQIGLEIHLSPDLKNLKERIELIHKMERKYGMVRFDSKPNPWYTLPVPLMDNRIMPMGYEIAWYNKKFLVKE